MNKIRWVIAHEPIDLFLRAAEKFSAELRETTGGALDIEILSLTDYAAKYHNGEKISKYDLLKLMEAGQVEMSQMYTSTLGRYFFDFYALDMPFLFQSHDHASRVLDGAIGQELLDGLTQASPFKGLAFTYSGGYRCIPAQKKLTSTQDFAGLKIRTFKSPVAVATFKALGAEPVPGIELEQMNAAADAGTITAGESTHVRIYPLGQDKHFAYVNDTRHSLFLTSMIVANDFWATLSPEHQAAIQAAARNAAISERQESVAQVAGIREQLGDNLVEMEAEQAARFAVAAKRATAHFISQFKGNVIERIMEASK